MALIPITISLKNLVKFAYLRSPQLKTVLPVNEHSQCEIYWKISAVCDSREDSLKWQLDLGACTPDEMELDYRLSYLSTILV